MSKIIIIASRPGVGKSSLAYKIFQEKLESNKKGFFFSLERNKEDIIKIVGKKYKNYIFDNQYNFSNILSFIKNKTINFLIIDYYQLLDNKKEEFKEFVEFFKAKNIDVYITCQLGRIVSSNKEPKIWHLDFLLRSIADEVIFLYFQDNKLTKKILNKEQIKEEEKQTPSLDRGLFGKLIEKKWIE